MKFRLSSRRKALSLKFGPLAIILAMGFVACKEKELKPAEVLITDPDRHYYPVIQGELLPIVYEIENTSKEPLVIQEIQTSCGCIVPTDELPIMVLPNKRGFIRLGYNSNKNTGHVEHQIYLYGNFTDSLYRMLKFDTNVVPPADYTRDYEVLWHEEMERGGFSLRDLVDGSAAEKGYYTDEVGDPRENKRKQRQEKADELLDF